MRRAIFLMMSSVAALGVAGCARTDAIQTDRTAFSFDSTFQKMTYSQPIETTFDRTVTVFREAGYTLDVVDRATGQISGRRGKTGDKGAKTEQGLRFYALVLPGSANSSQLALKFMQVSSMGVPVLNQTKTEMVLSQPELYAYVFRRVDDASRVAASPQGTPAGKGPTLDADLLPLEPTDPR